MRKPKVKPFDLVLVVDGVSKTFKVKGNFSLLVDMRSDDERQPTLTVNGDTDIGGTDPYIRVVNHINGKWSSLGTRG